MKRLANQIARYVLMLYYGDEQFSRLRGKWKKLFQRRLKQLSTIISGLIYLIGAVSATSITVKLFENSSVSNNSIEFNILKISSRYFEINLYPKNTELVTGFQGSYFSIDLKDADIRRPLTYFSKGEYHCRNKSLIPALQKFCDEVIIPLQQSNKKYQIFLRGNADALKFLKNDRPINKSLGNVIHYLPAIEIDQYSQKQSVYKLPVHLENRSLHFLRAQYVKDIFITNFNNLPEPLILEGTISNHIQSIDRNVEIILFVQK